MDRSQKPADNLLSMTTQFCEKHVQQIVKSV